MIGFLKVFLMTDATHILFLCKYLYLYMYIFVYTAFVARLCYSLRLWDKSMNYLDPGRGLLRPAGYLS